MKVTRSQFAVNKRMTGLRTEGKRGKPSVSNQREEAAEGNEVEDEEEKKRGREEKKKREKEEEEERERGQWMVIQTGYRVRVRVECNYGFRAVFDRWDILKQRVNLVKYGTTAYEG